MAGDRLSGLDASFLHLEDASAHMHVAGVMLFEGSPPPYDELLETFEDLAVAVREEGEGLGIELHGLSWY